MLVSEIVVDRSLSGWFRRIVLPGLRFVRPVNAKCWCVIDFLPRDILLRLAGRLMRSSFR